jgi:hypothetical protein
MHLVTLIAVVAVVACSPFLTSLNSLNYTLYIGCWRLCCWLPCGAWQPVPAVVLARTAQEHVAQVARVLVLVACLVQLQQAATVQQAAVMQQGRSAL